MIFIGNVSDHQSQKLDMMFFVHLVVQGSNKLSHNCLSQDLNTLCNVLSFYVFDQSVCRCIVCSIHNLGDSPR